MLVVPGEPSLKRLFVAVRPPPEVCSAIARIDRPELAGVRWSPAQQWHVTLVFLGNADPCEVGSALSSIRLPRCRAVIGPTVRTLGDHVLVVPVTGLETLADAVRGATDGLGGSRGDTPFDGHITIARIKARRGSARLGSLLGAPVSATWTPAGIELVSSVTDPRGAVHRIEGTFWIDDR